MTTPAKTRTTTDGRPNRAGSAPPDSARPILSQESGAFISRLREIIADESVSSFARRCGIKEAVIRSYINDGRTPPISNAAALAEAGGVTVDWLATGRGFKTRAELRAAQAAAEAPPPAREPAPAQYPAPPAAPIDPARLRLALLMAEDAAAHIPEATPERRADLILTFYQRLDEKKGP